MYNRLVLAVLAVLAWYLAYAVYNIFLNPLVKYRGPFLAKFSSWPSYYHALKGDRHIWIWQCFQTYGPVFRFEPNGILFNSPDAYRDIYGLKSNVQKSVFYTAWQRNAQDANTLNTVDISLHAKKRKLLNLVFTQKSLRSAGTFINRHVDRWNELIVTGDGRDWSEPRNMAEWNDRLVFDILGDLCFGKSFEIKEPGDNPLRTMPHTIASYMKFAYALAKSPLLGVICWLKPRGLNKLLELITPNEIKHYYAFIADSVSERMKMSKEAEERDLDESEMRKDMFHYFFQAKDPDTNLPAYNQQELHAEANLLIIAGTDTTSINLSGFFFYITHNPKPYAKLVNEIRRTFKSTDEIVGGPTLSSCVYLRACVDEAMRMTPAGPSELPRVVLKGGMEINGEFVPEGFTVGTAGWASGHNEEHYGDPNVYRPERWVVDDAVGNTAEEVAHLWTNFHPFSSGPGNCAGQNLAMLEMLTTVARTLYRFDVRLAPGSKLGEGHPGLGWGRNLKNQYQLRDAYISLRDGPLVQFKRREL